MTRALKSPRRAAVFALVVLLVAFVPSGVLGQAEDGAAETPTTALLTQDGWWNRAQGPQEGEPETPVRPVIGGTVPTPSTVPADALGVGALLGEPDKVAAIGFLLEAPIDAFVDRAVLTLKESTASNANANAAGAAIVACPITDFWAGVKNGEFVRRPTCDEGQAVPGVRAADGTWTFDLTSVGASWLDGTLMQNGVLLHEAVEPPVSFQVSFVDLATNGIAVDFATSGGGFSASSDFTLEESEVVADDSFASTTDEGFALDDSAGFDSGTTFDSGSAVPSSGATAGTGTAAPATGGPAPAAPLVASPASAATDLFGGLPIAALLLLLLLAAGAFVFLGLVLGPLAAPTPAPVRSGGVSRALAARDSATTRR